MDETRTAARSASPSDAPSHRTRRAFLVVGGVGVVGGAVGGALLGHSSGTRDRTPLEARVSSELAAAALAERKLIAGVDKALRSARGARRTALRQVRAGHLAHLHAVEGAIDVAVYPASRSTSPSAAPSPVATPSTLGVAAAEQRASTVAAARALRLDGAQATLLATIAAAEATHAALLGSTT